MQTLHAKLRYRKPFLAQIDLTSNHIEVIDDADAFELEQVLSVIDVLDLKDNGMKSISDHYLSRTPNLRHLSLSFNNLTRLPSTFLSAAPLLQKLSLSHNALSALPVDFLNNSPELYLLYINNNAIKRIQENFLKNNRKLSDFDASFNRNLELPHDFLSGEFPNLISVSLEGCDIESLPNTFLQHATDLEHVDLKRNNLKKLPQGLLKQTSIDSLEIDGNPVAYDDSYLKTLPKNIREAIKRVPESEDESEEDDQ